MNQSPLRLRSVGQCRGVYFGTCATLGNVGVCILKVRYAQWDNVGVCILNVRYATLGNVGVCILNVRYAQWDNVGVCILGRALRSVGQCRGVYLVH
jgi:hypothetical protein